MHHMGHAACGKPYQNCLAMLLYVCLYFPLNMEVGSLKTQPICL